MALKNITLTRKLRTDAAASWKRMDKAGMPSSRLESAWRSESTQQKLYEKWRAGKGNYALRPDQSNHVKGIAVDAHGAMQLWLIRNGGKHGWTQDRNEPWHFDYNADNDAVARLERAKRRKAEAEAAARKAAAAKVAAAAKKRAQAVKDMKAVQTILKRYGYTGAIDGIPGPKTETAWDKLTRATK